MRTVMITFSPTGGTQKVTDIIASGIGNDTICIDLCLADVDFSNIEIKESDLVLISMPSFAGRAPELAVKRLKEIEGRGASCTLICVYGNRHFDDTLAEMEDVAKSCGFKVTSAIAALAEHSIVREFAAERPDADDRKQLIEFAEKIKNLDADARNIPGNRPYRSGGKGSLVPKPSEACKKCGICAEKCPAQAISKDNFIADIEKCIGCMRCEFICPEKARIVEPEKIAFIAEKIGKACADRKENELFI